MFNRGSSRVRFSLAAGLAALAVASQSPASAQSQAKAPTITQRISLEGGELSKVLNQLGRQFGVQIAFLPDRVRGRKARPLKGNLTIDQALDKVLEGTGLRYQRTPNGSYIVGGPTTESLAKAKELAGDIAAADGIDANGRAAIPDILVLGKRDWNLNLDIPRTPNDAQPYIVYSREEIQRSGATSLEDFFRDFLGANNNGAISTQITTTKNQSQINLRGLGTAGTLILVDGRRYAQSNGGDGVFSQSSVNGIPLDAIERVEVLPASASGIYGSNAVGGVINIILKRDYHGIEATAYYGNSTRTDAPDARLSLNGSFPLEGGRTKVSFTGSWQKTGALYEGERDFIARGRELLSTNSPNYLATLNNPLAGTTPNIVSNDGGNLVLKPQYGGQSLGSRITYVPAGYRGVAQDGVAALIANAGKQNLNISPAATLGAAGNGYLSPLISPTQSYSGSLTVRREFNKWLSLYGEFGYNHYESSAIVNPAAGIYTLSASAADNPFTRSILVSVPVTEGNQVQTSSNRNLRAITGAIVKLPLDWQAALDLTWNWNRYAVRGTPPAFDAATAAGINNGSINFLSDVGQFPLQLGYLDGPSSGLVEPSTSSSRSYVLKLGGPVPGIRLPGGKPFLTLLLEQDKQTQGQYTSFASNTTNSSVSFTPGRSQRTDSAYGELRLPIIGKDNHVPLISEFELEIAGRYDRYVGIGSNATLPCFPAGGAVYAAPLPASAYSTACPAVGSQPVFERTDNHSINPTIAARWAVTKDLTFRGSYSTGYLPPYLNSVVPVAAGVNGTLLAGKAIVNVTDPQRGNERVGQSLLGLFQVVDATIGGNPNVDPQTSKTWSFGTILTPRFVPGLRISVDWSRITENNVYFQPAQLLTQGNTASGQQAFDDFLAAHPERFVRSTDPTTFGAYGVGPILSIDASTANLSRYRSEAVEFAVNYDHALAGGQISVVASATWLRDLVLQTTPSAAPTDATDVIDNGFLGALGGFGGIAWKGNGTVVYSRQRWSLGARVRYFGHYYLSAARTVNALQGSATIPAQAYVDLFGTFKITSKTELRAGVNDILDKSPPINATDSRFYSYFGDPRRANFYLSINRKF